MAEPQVKDFTWVSILGAMQSAEMSSDGLVKLSARVPDLTRMVCYMHEQRAETIDVEMPTMPHAKKLNRREKRAAARSRKRREFIINDQTWRQDGFFVINASDFKILDDLLIHTSKHLPVD